MRADMAEHLEEHERENVPTPGVCCYFDGMTAVQGGEML